jgi:hypothetical protein
MGADDDHDDDDADEDDDDDEKVLDTNVIEPNKEIESSEVSPKGKSRKSPKQNETVKKGSKKSLNTKPNTVMPKRRTKKLKLKRGTMITVARMFGVHPSTISRIWNRACDSYWKKTNGADIYESASSFQVVPQKKFKTGRKPKWNPTEIRAAIAKLPDGGSHQSLRQLAAIVHVPYTTLHRLTQRKPGEPLLPPPESVQIPEMALGENSTTNDSNNTNEGKSSMESPPQHLKEEKILSDNLYSLNDNPTSIKESQISNGENTFREHSTSSLIDENMESFQGSSITDTSMVRLTLCVPETCILENSSHDDSMDSTQHDANESSMETLQLLSVEGVTTSGKSQVSHAKKVPVSNECTMDNLPISKGDIFERPNKRICVSRED